MQGLPPAIRLIGIGWYFAVCIVAGLVGGVFLDRAADTTPWLTLVGLFLGLLTAFWGGYRMLQDVLGPSLTGSEPGEERGENE